MASLQKLCAGRQRWHPCALCANLVWHAALGAGAIALWTTASHTRRMFECAGLLARNIILAVRARTIREWLASRFAIRLARLKDTVHIAPSEFGKSTLQAVTHALCEKYPNKVVPGLGLCIALHDILHIGESQLYPGSAAQHISVEFRIVMFHPYEGEVLTGTVVACDPEGIRVSIGFFDEIHVPARLLQPPSFWSAEEGVWVWDVTSDDQLFYDLENPLRFRVKEINFRQETNTAAAAASGAGSSCAGSGMTTGLSKPRERLPTHGGSGKPLAPIAPAMTIVASVDQPGLGLTSWWPPDAEGEDEEEGADE